MVLHSSILECFSGLGIVHNDACREAEHTHEAAWGGSASSIICLLARGHRETSSRVNELRIAQLLSQCKIGFKYYGVSSDLLSLMPEAVGPWPNI